MASTRRSWWALYTLGVLLILGALAWVSSVVLDLDRAEGEARLEQSRQQSIRLALWRMDSWLGPQLAVEVARLPGEYQAYTPQVEAYTKVLSQIEPGEVLVPSPLLTFDSEIIQLHFEVDDRGGWSSPQIPESNCLDLAEANGLVAPVVLGERKQELEQLQSCVGYGDLTQRIEGAEENFGQLFLAEQESDVTQQDLLGMIESPEFGNAMNVRERGWRAQVTQQTQMPAEAEDSPVFLLNNSKAAQEAPAPEPVERRAMSSSPLVPLWIDRGERLPLLCFARRVQTSSGEVVQGFLVDWAHLRSGLISLVADILPEADVEPNQSGDPRADMQGRLLATIPATLEPGALSLPVSEGWTTGETTLLFGWLVALLSLGVVGFSLRSSIDYGEQRSRFAGAVTHELRTPLTTFRLYSDMLASGMVPEGKRQEYLETLRGESDRLTILVENVLCYARLEKGSHSLKRCDTTVGNILDRARPDIQRRVREARMRLLEVGDELREERLQTDPEAVAQVLFNLVDNACKYGRVSDGGEVELSVGLESTWVVLRVRDGGPGVPLQAQRKIFQAFDRGRQAQADPNPGIGLGLALSRGLARDLGGELELESSAGGPGASFCLRLPRG